MVYHDYDLTDAQLNQRVNRRSSWKSQLETSAIIALAVLLFLTGFGAALIFWPILDFWPYDCWATP
ncbi:hypothetical protein [Sulfitobacter sp.]|jgi:hypothetical protein|uniref:hypothetical protein n=1 Tax=Sulfitobacter sp. TaxID=1903071 RepID=UPI000C0EB1AF|nr:hypothetical protein [Roseobacter sp.]MBV49838.1 hypothetical protein [Roseobacter sp.]PHR05826.1 MAG: hypothetical protein COB29_11355 [Sulfitobacter sp.]|tara:strand:+ start:1051 stop:1248 length:198 start_codon:yes stop_codon:yes gene_type:complete